MIAALLACLGLGTLAFGGDAGSADIKAVLARVQALEEKNKQLEDKLKAAQAVGPATANVDKAVASSAATLSSVVTTADPHCRPLVIGGYLDATYQYNFNRPENQTNNQRIFDNDSNGFNMHLAELTFQRLPTDPGQAGFRIDTAFGTDARVFASQDTQGTGRGNQFEVVDLKQAYIEYIAGVGCGNGVTIDMGKFVTWAGAEVIEASDNMNASRSFLFGDAIPFTHTGLRATYTPFKDKWTIGAGVVNSWDFIQNPMNSPTAIWYSSYTPLKWLTWQLDGTIGNELFIDERQRFADATSAATFANPNAPELDPTDPNTPGAKSTVLGKKFDPRNSNQPRALVDTVITFANLSGPFEKFTFVLNADYATEGQAPNELPGVTTVHKWRNWYGGAVYAKYQATKNWYIAGRYEYFNDPQGVRTGFRQALQSATITADWALSDPLHIRFEYRHDMSNIQSFSTQRDINSVDFATQAHPFDRKYQDTIMMQWLYKF
jgi:hypothetical protein